MRDRRRLCPLGIGPGRAGAARRVATPDRRLVVMVLATAWLVLASVVQGPAGAAEIACTRPVPPLCLEEDVTFADGARMRSCRSQILLYVDAVKTYLRCLAEEHYRVENEMQKTIRAFNCRLAGQTGCL